MLRVVYNCDVPWEERMSEFTDQKDIKQEALKGIIKKLHDGVPVDRLKKEFRQIIKDTSPEEIADMENALILEGFPPEEIQKLCDVHAEVFEEALSKVGRPSKMPGHPVHTFLEENKRAKKILKEVSKAVKRFKKGTPKDKDVADFQRSFSVLNEIERHYERKENQLFPVLEEKAFQGPSKVMWGKHDEIRELLKSTARVLETKEWRLLPKRYRDLSAAIKKMIFLEEKILFPASARKLTTADWVKIKSGEAEIGYAWVKPSNLWDTHLAETVEKKEDLKTQESEIKEDQMEKITLEEGALTPEQLNAMLKTLPVDITYVDENDTVCYYSASNERIFPRSPAVIGRKVQNCHPPKSLHVVDEILGSFKKKKKESAEFWIQKNGMLIYIRYFPLYDERGEYQGVIEVSQEVSGIQKLEGERRILDW